MSAHDVISLLLERGNAMQTFWGFYISISLGVLALVANAKGSTRLPHLAALLSVGFVAFASANFCGISAVEKQREFFYQQLDHVSVTPPVGDPSGATVATDFKKAIPQPPSVRPLHIGADIGVLAAIWLITFLGGRSKRRLGPAGGGALLVDLDGQ